MIWKIWSRFISDSKLRKKLRKNYICKKYSPLFDKSSHMKLKKYSILFVLSIILASCSLTKYVPENKYLLDKVSISSDIKELGEEELRPFLRQKPNPGVFGLYRMQLKVYNLSGSDTLKWYNKMFRRMGEAPVIFSHELTERSREEMRKGLANKGYINAQVKVDISFNKKKTKINYLVTGNAPYHIRNVIYEIEDDSIRSFILNDTVNSALSSGLIFDVDLLEAERKRLVTMLRREGFYYFNKDYLFIEADSSLNANQVDIVLKSRPMVQAKPDGTFEKKAHKRLQVRSVSFLPWYDPNKKVKEQINDTLFSDGYIFFYDKARELKPLILVEKTFILPHAFYDEHDVERTYTALNALGTSKYVNIMFRERDDNYLDCFIMISPTKVQAFSVEIEGNNTDGDIGAAVSGTYQHRNLFHGAELFTLKTRTAYQPMGEMSKLLSNNSIDVGGEASVSFPRFLFPFLSYSVRQRVRSSTEFSVSYNYQTNPWFSRTISGAGIKYLWTTGSRNNERYGIDLVDFSYVYLPRISDQFKETYLNTSSIIRYSYEDHFIMSSGLSFFRNTHNPAHPLRSSFAYKGKVEAGGNILSAICSVAGAHKEDGAYVIGGIRYAQYAKGEIDFSRNHVIDNRNKLVYRAQIGLAYPYGNADVVPFEKRFFAGGANSVRGWSVRTLGPGIYKSTTSGVDFMQTGDIKLDLNFEYRFKLFWVLEGAAFADAGNVWTINSYRTQEGGLFQLDSFYKQIAYSYGVGMRLDFSFFLFRVDMGVKAYDPTLEGAQKWRYPIKSSDFAYHFAIGYPF